ncbi:MAG: ABC transporter ATP-binding protein [Lachnospiraceae bacterium]|nr:ABC transporter ATP-binding protein [Lachnospiraceae bacterium]
MIEAINLTKRFEDIVAVDSLSATIKDGGIFGLVGTNGAGKSTFLRMACGVLRPDIGEILVDQEPVYECTTAKAKLFYISDEQYFFSNATPLEVMDYYALVYPGFRKDRFHHLMKSFELDERRRINTFSKGMKKQVSVICGLCADTGYLLCDETFDGLDPVMRQTVKSLLAYDMEERGLTCIVASHNLRELEDICDHVGLLHKGGMILSKELDEMKSGLHRVQCVLKEGDTVEVVLGAGAAAYPITVVKSEQRGRLTTLTLRGRREDIERAFAAAEPLFYELIPLSLEEIFISEMEVVGYDIHKFLF